MYIVRGYEGECYKRLEVESLKKKVPAATGFDLLLKLVEDEIRLC